MGDLKHGTIGSLSHRRWQANKSSNLSHFVGVDIKIVYFHERNWKAKSRPITIVVIFKEDKSFERGGSCVSPPRGLLFMDALTSYLSRCVFQANFSSRGVFRNMRGSSIRILREEQWHSLLSHDSCLLLLLVRFFSSRCSLRLPRFLIFFTQWHRTANKLSF